MFLSNFLTNIYINSFIINEKWPKKDFLQNVTLIFYFLAWINKNSKILMYLLFYNTGHIFD